MIPTRCRYGAALFAVFLPISFPRAGAQAAASIPSQQLDDLVAPIALYPDSLVAQLLAASTYPIEIAEAEQWVKDHVKWKPAKLMDGAKKQTWDSSVEAMVAFPQVLSIMNQSLTWTTQLGNAFLAEQADVDAGGSAYARPSPQLKGTLHSTEKINVMLRLAAIS